MKSEKTEKYEHLLKNTLLTQESLSTEGAAELLGVSVSTARRLFLNLQESGDAIRCFGGICRREGDYSFDALNTASANEKLKIGNFAFSILPESGAIYLDGGTTVARLATSIAEAGGRKDPIFTNSLVNLNLLSSCCDVQIIGGRYRENRRDFCGFLAEESVKRLHFSACFLGADALDMENGFSATDFDTAKLNSTVLGCSDLRCVLIDSSKFGKTAFVKYATTDMVTHIITDAPPKKPFNSTNNLPKLLVAN